MSTAETSIFLNAPPSRIWAVLTDFSSWPEWNPMFSSIALTDPAQPFGVGSHLHFQPNVPGLPTSPVTVEITACAVPEEFVWVGGPLPKLLSWLGGARHWFRLREEEEGTVFEQGETVFGLLGKVVPAGMIEKIERAQRGFNEGLKKRVEEGR